MHTSDLVHEQLTYLQELVHQHYPQAEAAVLTGSQAQYEIIDTKRDIDLILFSKNFHGKTLHVYKEAGIAIDFLKISTHTLAEILDDESYNENAILLHMLVNSKIIYDPFEIAAAVKEQAFKLYHSGHKELDKQIANTLARLRHVRKNLVKKKGPIHDFYLINDFSSLVTRIHLLSETGWAHRSIYGVAQLLLLPNNFTNNLIDLVKGFTVAPDKYRSLVLNYIDYFSSIPYPSTIKPAWTSRVIALVSYVDNSVQGFAETGLPLLLQDPILKSCFQYCFWPKQQYALSEKIALVFEYGTKESFINLVMLKLNEQLEIDSANKLTNFKLIMANYPGCLPGGENQLKTFDKALKNVTLTILLKVKQKKYSKSYMLLLSCILITALINTSKLEVSDALQTLKYMYNKFLYDERLLVDADKCLMEAVYLELEKSNAHYSTHNADLCWQVVQTTWADPTHVSIDELDVTDFCRVVKNYFDSLNQLADLINPLNYGWQELKQDLSPQTTQNNAALVVLCTEHIFETLGLSHNSFSLVIRIISDALTNITA